MFINALDTGALVTVLEIISPNNKTKFEEMENYKQRREQLLVNTVHCVELDLTRSMKRLLDDPVSQEYPYHIAIHLHNEDARFIGMTLQDKLKSFALPLRREILPIDLNSAYRQAYAQLSIALQIYENGQYSESHLPFPSLIKPKERQQLLEQVEAWKQALKEAESSKS